MNLLIILKEHFINWMEMETFSTFKKLWGRIDEDLDADLYYVEVHDSNLFDLNKQIKII